MYLGLSFTGQVEVPSEIILIFLLKGSNPKTSTLGFASIHTLDCGALPDKPTSILIEVTKLGIEILPAAIVIPEFLIKYSIGGTSSFSDIAL
jgi:hypothetical protein